LNDQPTEYDTGFVCLGTYRNIELIKLNYCLVWWQNSELPYFRE